MEELTMSESTEQSVSGGIRTAVSVEVAWTAFSFFGTTVL
jgi:hypothetical protein